jgi:predicted GIY-YIG superfamily endonuclease
LSAPADFSAPLPNKFACSSSIGTSEAKYNVHRLIYFEELPDMGAARERERRLKGLNRAKKDALVYAVNPELRDLSDEIPGRPSDV